MFIQGISCNNLSQPFFSYCPPTTSYLVTRCAILMWHEEGEWRGWALNLASDPVVQQGALLLHNFLFVCVCVCWALVCSGEAPNAAAYGFNICVFF